MQVLGASLYGGNRARLLVIVHGPTTTGKTTLFGACLATLGDYAGMADPAVFRGSMSEGARPDLLNLLPKRLVVLEEAGSSWELHADRVKMMTGGVPIRARALYANRYVERLPDFTPVIVSNEVPRMRGRDDAVWRRTLAYVMGERLLPGEEQPTFRALLERDPRVRESLLARLVAAGWRATGGVPAVPDSVRISSAAALGEMDDVAEFLQELADEGRLSWSADRPASSCVKPSELHKEYVRWVRERGDVLSTRDRLNSKQFRQRLKSDGWEYVTSDGGRWLGFRLEQSGFEWRPQMGV
jgi:putative DNA primase/helicase